MIRVFTAFSGYDSQCMALAYRKTARLYRLPVGEQRAKT